MDSEKPKKIKKKTNEHGANQYKVDPRQMAFLANYLDPDSETFSNGKASAIKAGYTERYGDVLVANMPTWLSGSMNDLKLVAKAERNLGEFLDVDVTQQALGAFGPIYERKSPCCNSDLRKDKDAEKNTIYICLDCEQPYDGSEIIAKPVLVRNAKVMGLKLDASKFVAERLNRKKYGKDESSSGNNQYNFFILNDEQQRRLAKRVIERTEPTPSGSKELSG